MGQPRSRRSKRGPIPGEISRLISAFTQFMAGTKLYGHGKLPRSPDSSPSECNSKLKMPTLPKLRLGSITRNFHIPTARSHIWRREYRECPSFCGAGLQDLREYAVYQFACLWRCIQGGLLNDLEQRQANSAGYVYRHGHS